MRYGSVRSGRLLSSVLALALSSPTMAAAFRYAVSGDVLTMDPHSGNEAITNAMQANIYEALVQRRWDLLIEPALAESWSQPDPLTWRFKLRQGVTFHDGTPFTADDVVFSFHRMKHKNSTKKDALALVKEVRKIDDYTIDYITNGPSPVLLRNLPLHFIMSRKWCEDHGTTEPSALLEKEVYATRHANGTGPFMLVERVIDTRTVLAPNQRWWANAKKQHNLTRIEFRPISNAATRISALLSGEVDFVSPVPLQDVPRISATPGFKIVQGPEARVIYLGFDQFRDELLDMPKTGKNPFKDVRVRRAFYQAIDVEAIHRKIMRGFSIPTGVMVAKELPGYDPQLAKRLPYDPEAARKLLVQAGYPDGFPVTLDCPNDRYVNDEAVCQAVVSMLGRIGVKVTLNAQTKSKWLLKLTRKEASFYLGGYTPITYEAYNTLLGVMSLTGEGAGTFNGGRYTNPEVERLVAAIGVEMDEAKRNRMISEALRIHNEDIGHIPLYQPTIIWGIREGVDVKLHPGDQVQLRYVRVKEAGTAALERP